MLLVHLHELRFTLKNHKRRLIEKFGKCAYCESTKDLTLDHLIPKSKGGSDTQDNLVLACQYCNNRKANKDLANWLKYTGQTLSEVLEQRIVDTRKKDDPNL